MAKVGLCWLCENSGPLQEHHEWMQAAGGKELPTVDLCATCHDGIHRQAKNLIGKGERVQYLPTHLLEKAAPLIRLVCRALLELKENRPVNSSVKAMLDIPIDLHTQLHRLKMDAGYTNYSDFLVQVLREYAARKL